MIKSTHIRSRAPELVIPKMSFDLEDFIAEIQKRFKEDCGLTLPRDQINNAGYLYSALKYMNEFDDEPSRAEDVTYKVDPGLLVVLDICKQRYFQPCLECFCKTHADTDRCAFGMYISELLKYPAIAAWNVRTQPKKTMLKIPSKKLCAYGKNCLNRVNGCTFSHKMPNCAYGTGCQNFANGGSSHCHLTH